ncbi:MAG: hypothetical protein JWO45_1828, partial [Spartobacteria bacterium]|nr:hypothetical protein [Spartobacteria bacterium]
AAVDLERDVVKECAAAKRLDELGNGEHGEARSVASRSLQRN